MFCKYCGLELTDDARFCPGCGVKVEWNIKGEKLRTIHLKCKNCQGNMDVDASRQVAVCPYCGERMLILDSDFVAAEKAKAAAYKEVEFAKLADEKEKREFNWWKEQAEQFENSKLAVMCILLAFICFIVGIVCFSLGKALLAFIALAQVALFVVAWLMGMHIVKEPKRSFHVLFAVAGFLLIILFFVSCSHQL